MEQGEVSRDDLLRLGDDPPPLGLVEGRTLAAEEVVELRARVAPAFEERLQIGRYAV